MQPEDYFVYQISYKFRQSSKYKIPQSIDLAGCMVWGLCSKCRLYCI